MFAQLHSVDTAQVALVPTRARTRRSGRRHAAAALRLDGSLQGTNARSPLTLTPAGALSPEPALPSVAAPLDSPSVEHFDLSNGIPTYVVSRPNAGQTTLLLFNTFSEARDPSVSTALRQLVIHGTLMGTRGHPGTQWREAGAAIGMRSSALAGTFGTLCSFTFDPGSVDVAMGLIAETVTEPAFTEQWFQSERAQTIDLTRQWRASVSGQAASAWARALFGAGHSLARGWVDYDAEPSTWTLAAVRAHHTTR